MNKKLTTEQKLSITLSRTTSLRAIAEGYNVHHSVIADIFNESEELLKDYWTEKSKRTGRPCNDSDVEVIELTTAEQEKASLQKELALKHRHLRLWLK